MRLRILEPGYRLLNALVLAGLTYVLSFRLTYPGARIVLAWNVGAAVLLSLIAIMMWQCDAAETLRRARKEEITAAVILSVTIVIVAGALVTIIYSERSARSLSNALRIFQMYQSVVAVLLAWFLLHMTFSLHYAKEYYGEIEATCPNAFSKGLAFPGNNNDVVDYWDFVYFAFTIAMCYQTSDIMVTSPAMRRLTILHAIISFFFTLVILGLLLDVISSGI